MHNKNLKTCDYCSCEFIDNSRSKNAQYCSKEHKNKSWYQQNREHALVRCRKYEQNNVEKIKERKRHYTVERRKVDINFKLAFTLRCRLVRVIKQNKKVGSFVHDLGCSINELKNYIEHKWQPGMTWDNWSKNGWHIDHIIPLASFNLSDPTEFKKACNYINLQPLWACDNIRKGDRM